MSTDLVSPAKQRTDLEGGSCRAVPLGELLEKSDRRVVVIGASKDPNAKVTLLLFRTGAADPDLAVKVPTTDAATALVDAEGRMLVELHRRRPRGILGSIPRVVDTVNFQGRLGIVTTAVAGVPMTTSYLLWHHTARRSRIEADFAAVARWLAIFQHETAGARAPVDIVGGISTGLMARFGEDPAITRCLECLSEIESRLRRYRTPRSAVHGDFWCGNVLLSGGTVSGVVDWELGTMSGEPLRDLVRFVHMYALYLDRHTRPGRPVAGHSPLRAGTWGAGVIHALEGRGWFHSLFRGFLQRGLSRLGVPPECWRDAALAGIAEVAATTDDPDFARNHLVLFERLTTSRNRSEDGGSP